MKIQNDSKLLFIGDSITDCGREYPTGKKNGLGNGYVKVIRNTFSAGNSPNSIEIVNTGISGNRVIDLEERWQNDVIDLKPDWLSIMIGINDVWRHFDSSETVQVSTDKFKKVYEKLLERTISKLSGLILLSPYLIEKDKNDPMRRMMDEYGNIVRNIARKYNAIFVDAQKGFDEYLESKSASTLAGDRIHPNIQGHCIIADCFLKAIEYK